MQLFIRKLIMIILLYFLVPQTNLNADEGLNITCINMKNILGQNYKPLKFKLEAVGFQYFDENLNKFVTIKSNKLVINDNFLAVRIKDYELGFQMIKLNDHKKPTLVMSKYHFKSGLFLDHYKCNSKKSYLN